MNHEERVASLEDELEAARATLQQMGIETEIRVKALEEALANQGCELQVRDKDTKGKLLTKQIGNESETSEGKRKS